MSVAPATPARVIECRSITRQVNHQPEPDAFHFKLPRHDTERQNLRMVPGIAKGVHFTSEFIQVSLTTNCESVDPFEISWELPGNCGVKNAKRVRAEWRGGHWLQL